MPRITLEIPSEVLSYTTRLAVRLSDLNPANHMGNDALVRAFSDVRTQFWADSGVPELDPDDPAGGVGMIIADQVMLYRAEAHLGDTLRFDVGVHELNRYGGDVVARISRDDDGTVIALGKAGFVYFDYATGKVCAPPPVFVQQFGTPPA